MTNNPGLLSDELATREDSEVRDATYSVTCSELRVFVGVDFQHNGLTCHVLCGARDLWGGGATRAAPVSPEIDKDRNARALDDFVEERSVDL